MLKIKQLASQQLSEEYRIQEYFVRADLGDEFVDRCISIAQQR
jgi:hypothetical protein